jgi:hypothetical protein
MAQLSEKLILELQKIIKEDYGREVTLAEARSIGETLTDYYDLLGKIYHRMKTDGPAEK